MHIHAQVLGHKDWLHGVLAYIIVDVHFLSLFTIGLWIGEKESEVLLRYSLLQPFDASMIHKFVHGL